VDISWNKIGERGRKNWKNKNIWREFLTKSNEEKKEFSDEKYNRYDEKFWRKFSEKMW